MLYLALAQLLLIGFLLWRMSRERDAHAQTLAEFAREAAEERSELLTRIQHPQVIPVRRSPKAETDDDETAVDESNKVGLVL